MKYLIDPANLSVSVSCKKRVCDVVCDLCPILNIGCSPKFIPLYGIDPVEI